MSETDQETAPRKRRSAFVRIVQSHDFLRDIVVTTLGVLIALGIGELVDELRWRIRLQAVQQTMNQELGMVRGVYAERILFNRCVRIQLLSLEEVLETARKTGRLPDIRKIGTSPDHGAFGDSWALAQSSDVLIHMPPDEAMKAASRWVNVKAVTDAIAEQREAFDGLQILWGRPGPVSSEVVENGMRLMLTGMTAENRIITLSLRDYPRLAEANVPLLDPRGNPLDVGQTRASLQGFSMCAPLEVDGKPYQPSELPANVPLPKDLAA